MKKIITLAVLLLVLQAKANVTAYFNYGVFTTPSHKSYLETYMTILGNSVHYQPVAGGFQASVQVSLVIRQGEQVLVNTSYNLMGPLNPDTLSKASFIDNQRYSLPNGIYTLELSLRDNNAANAKSFLHKEELTINYTGKVIESSSIQPLESFAKVEKPTAISKSGMDLIPYNLNYFPESQQKLAFYIETYNLDTILGKGSRFVYNFYVERNEDLQKQEGMFTFKKQLSAKVNPLLGSFNIAALPSGGYNLVVEVRDTTNKLQFQKKWFFQRKNPTADLVLSRLLADRSGSVDEFFGTYNNVDTLKMFIECLWPISTSREREWQQNQLVKKDPELMKKFVVQYWKNKSGDTLNPMQLWLDYYKRVLQANMMFTAGKQKGYYTDRGRVYLQYGPPDQRSISESQPNSYPYEIWQYYRLKDATTGQFLTNKRFVFINFEIAGNRHQLVHSDVKGEMRNDQWKMQLMKRSVQSSNFDQTDPGGTYGNNVDDLYNNTR